MTKIITSPKACAILGATMTALPCIKKFKPILEQYSTPISIVGMGLMAYAGLEKVKHDANKLVSKRNRGELDNLVKTQAKWTPIEISELSAHNLKKMNLEKPLLPETVESKIDTQMAEIGNWKSNIGVHGISQTYQSLLLYGPTGSGKSSVARQMIAQFDKKAKEDSKKHYHIKIEPTMLSSEHGNAKLGKLLDDIKNKVANEGADKVAFSILMDECDGALKAGLETANQYNTMIDAFTKEMNIPILQILTTNHLDDIDARTIRLGRCGTKVEIPNPDKDTKLEIMKQAINQFTYNGKTMADMASGMDNFKSMFNNFGLKDMGNFIENIQQNLSGFSSEIFNPILDALMDKTVECNFYNPSTRKNEQESKSLNNLLDDDSISGATISEITLKMVKALTIKAQTIHTDQPNERFLTDVLNVINKQRTPADFIEKYDMQKIISDAIGEALTQKVLEDNQYNGNHNR